MKKRIFSGFSLIELLVVITIFALLGVLITFSLAFSMKGGKKSESINKVRGNLDYAISVMERQLRNADEIVYGCQQSSYITYKDQKGVEASFSLDTSEDLRRIASSSGDFNKTYLTSDDVFVDRLNFDCMPAEKGATDSVKIEIIAHDAKASGVESAKVTVETRINLRNY